MTLPKDFEKTLATVEQYNILGEQPGAIRDRLVLALQGVALVEGGPTLQLGVFDWVGRLIRDFEAAIHKEICDSTKGGLKDEYQDLLKKGLTSDGVTAVATVVLKVVQSINPAYAVASVGIYLAVWLLKVGLNYWCSKAPAP